MGCVDGNALRGPCRRHWALPASPALPASQPASQPSLATIAYSETMSEQRTELQTLEVFVVDPAAAAPPYRQLHDSVVRGITEGQLLPGQRLPTTRALAAHLGLAVNTVAGAYRALEESGIVEGRGRAGTFVALGDDPVAAAARTIAIGAATRLLELGLNEDDARRMLGEAVTAASVESG